MLRYELIYLCIEELFLLDLYRYLQSQLLDLLHEIFSKDGRILIEARLPSANG